ncbi:hypothetical protein D3C86_1355700 [compost metagenome]
MDEGVHDAVGDLAGRQREGRFGIEDREAGVDVLAHERELLAGLPLGDDRVAVHLGAGRRQGQDRAKRQRRLDARALGQDVPGIALEVHGRRDELGPVEDRAAADGEQELHALLAHQLDGGHQGLEPRVGLDAAELQNLAPRKRLLDLVVHAVGLDAAAAVGQEDLGAGRDLLCQAGDLALAEVDPDRVLETEVLHG